MEHTIVDTEMAIALIPKEEQDHTRHLCRHIIEKNAKSNDKRKHDNVNEIIRVLKQTLNANNVITTKADKENTTVLIKKNEYIEKTEKLIKETGYKKIGNDPTGEYQVAIKSAIKRATTIIKENEAGRLTSMNPSAPPMISLPKIRDITIIREKNKSQSIVIILK
ncbi:uncharacterized protein LOC118732776 [Rhagoletis pomonella]|uniref:uncharacterized protein LOC118732776 n=1 Tax=Rhagoletis pomonella TaxID=28610 RepID=UPI0017823209|nr:uncharacterized protein LOC118732776 [Rhagoletis pomonella]